MWQKRILPIILLIMLFLVYPLWSGTTGKIAGTVTDKTTGEPLSGANIIIEGTNMGSAADINGQFTILHIPPGTYSIQVSMMGYANLNITDVRVRIDQTSRVDFSLEMETLEGETVTIVAHKTLIKEDVAQVLWRSQTASAPWMRYAPFRNRVE